MPRPRRGGTAAPIARRRTGTSRGDAASGEGCGTYAERSENERAGGCYQGLSPGDDDRAPERGCAQPRAPGGGGGGGGGGG